MEGFNHFRGNILAPMVRAGTLPLREIALEYGASSVYSEELIDRSILQTVRSEDDRLGTIDFKKDNRSVFSTTKTHHPCILQMGTNNASNALKAAEMVIGGKREKKKNLGTLFTQA